MLLAAFVTVWETAFRRSSEEGSSELFTKKLEKKTTGEISFKQFSRSWERDLSNKTNSFIQKHPNEKFSQPNLDNTKIR